MTCIVGLIHDGKVYMGGDSAGVAGLDLTVRRDSKVFRVGQNEEFLIGFTSSFRMGQLLRYTFEPGECAGDDVERYMAVDFVDATRDCLKKGGFATLKDGVEAAGSFLVGFRGRLFSVASNYQVGEAQLPHDAVGSGAQVALGSLYASVAEVSPEARLRTALAAAEQYSAGVRRPFYVLQERG